MRYFLAVAGFLPLRLFRAAGGVLGLLLYWANSHQTRAARNNLAHCRPELSGAGLESLVRAILVQAGMVITENFWIWSRSSEQIAQLVTIAEGEELFRSTLQQKKGLVLLSTHGANPDLVARWTGGVFQHIWTIYTPPRTSRYMQQQLPHLRQHRSNLKLAATDRGGGALRRLYRSVLDGGAALLWTDLDPIHGKGKYAPLFGLKARTPVLPCRMAALPGVSSLWCWCSRTPGGFALHFRSADRAIGHGDITSAVAALNRDLEQVILSLGAGYFYWTYKRFRHQPDGYMEMPPKPDS